MGAIAGAVRFDGESIPSELLEGMNRALRYRAPDGQASWEAAGIGLAHAHHWTTPEEVGEQQPIASRDNRFHLTADARIDNREELIHELAAAGVDVTDTSTDARLILAAFEHWGEACVPRLLGDFAFAVWDGVQRQLFLARDVMGLRQLYYTRHGGMFLFATTLQALLVALPTRPPLNRPLIEEFLRDYYRRWVRETVYQEIERLPPAHQLTVSTQGSQERLYYVLGSAPRPNCVSDSDWGDSFRAVLREAVRCRLRSRTPVGVVTGGGLDSSAIACVAHEVAGEDPSLPEVQLHAAYHQDPPADERRHFDTVARHCNRCPAFRIPADDAWALKEYGTDDGFPLDEPELYPLRSHTLSMLRSASAQGAQVVLFGEGANQVLGHAIYYNPAALLGVPLRDVASELPHFLRANQNRLGRILFHAFVRPLLPDALVERLRPLRLGSAEWPTWVVRSKDAAVPARPLPAEFTNPPGLTRSAHLAHQALRGSFDIARLAALDVTCAYAGVEWRLPFMDRRVVEFLLAVPPRMRSWQGEDRRILRESMRETLPDSVRLRRDKASMAGLIRRGLQEKARGRIEELLKDSRSAQLGYVKPVPLRHAFDAYWAGKKTRDYRILIAVAIEAWLRSLPEHDIIESRS